MEERGCDKIRYPLHLQLSPVKEENHEKPQP
jgi:hypothetical protein